MGKPLKVLLVEDSVSDAELLVLELRKGEYEPACERVETVDAFKGALESKQWDIVISDYSLPSFIAPDALCVLHDLGIDLPFIIISGVVGEEKAVEAMRAGAHDFINKANYTRLLPVIERELREARLRKKHKRAEKELSAKTKSMVLLNKDLHALTMEISHVEDLERKRFAEILHDDLGQKLVAIEMGISAHIKTCTDNTKSVQKLNDINALLRGTIDSIREMSSDLYPVNPYELELIDRKGLVEATRWYVSNILEPAGYSVKIEMDSAVDRFSYDFKQQLYRVIQECFQNSIKHSSSSKIKVKCTIKNNILRLSIEDNGSGVPCDMTGSKKGGGVGLRLMRERIKSLNGVLTIKSAKDAGMVVSAIIPMISDS